MSSPFGPSPNYQEYFLWAEKHGGCTVQYGHNMSKSVVKLTGPNGKYVLVVGIPDGEPMRHSVVASYDRVLGIDSPFPKTPKPYS